MAAHGANARAPRSPRAAPGCAAPRLAHFTVEPSVLARAVAALRTLRVTTPENAAPEGHEQPLDPQRDRAALLALTEQDPTGRALLERALATGSLRARYPLATEHPLADQVLQGNFQVQIGSIPTELWLRVPVQLGRTAAGPTWSPVLDGSLARAFAAWRPSSACVLAPCSPPMAWVSPANESETFA